MRPSAAEWSLLILLGASLLALHALRESYLKIWVLGWIALVACRLAEHCVAAKMPPPFDQVVVQAVFVAGCGPAGRGSLGVRADARPVSFLYW